MGGNGRQGAQAEDKLMGKGKPCAGEEVGAPSGSAKQRWSGDHAICDHAPFIHREGKKNKDKEQLLNQANCST